MKKFLAMAVVALSLAACNDEGDEATVETDTTSTTTTTTTTSEAYNPAEGDVTYRERKVMVWRNGQWVESESDVTLDNGVVVSREGRVRKGDQERELEEGEVVNRTGDFFDSAGQKIENAWDATKAGVKKAAGEVKEEVNDLTTDDNKQ